MDLELGIVCGRCDRYAPMGTAACAQCANPLALEPRPELPAPAEPPKLSASKITADLGASMHPPREPSPSTPSASSLAAAAVAAASSSPAPISPPVAQVATVSKGGGSDAPPASILGFQELRPRRVPSTSAIRAPSSGGETSVSSPDPGASAQHEGSGGRREQPIDVLALAASMNITLEELMDQAKNFVCRSCSTPVPVGHKFCGRCGAAIPPEIAGARTQFFGQLQTPGKAKLILIRGEGVEGLSYQLNAEQHIVGRNGQLVFPDDPYVSPKHANLFYRNGKLVVRDEGSLNGVFVRVKGTVELLPGDAFMAGEQIFRFDPTPKANDGPAPDGTYFYSSPKHQTLFRVTQILAAGAPGMVVCARAQTLQIGREGGDLNFPGDLYMSATHCKIDEAQGKYTLTDVNSRNGTYLRLRAERELAHGDYLFIGRKLLRVEITAA